MDLEKFYRAMGLEADATLDDLERMHAHWQQTFAEQMQSPDPATAERAQQNRAKLEKVYALLKAHMPPAAAEPAPAAVASPPPLPQAADENAGVKAKLQGLGGLLDKAKTASNDAVVGAKEKTNQVVAATMAEIRALEPVLLKSGFIVGDISISFPPKFSIVIEQVKEGKVVLGELTGQLEALSKTQQAIVKALQKAYSLEDQVNPFGYTIGQVGMELGVSTSLTVHLNSQKSRSFG